nr:phosphotransacetylase family protein [Petrachloros mirabilis]
MLVGSVEAYSGKSATILGLAQLLVKRGVDFAYGKPLGTYQEEAERSPYDQDVNFITKTLGLPDSHVCPTILSPHLGVVKDCLQHELRPQFEAQLMTYRQSQAGDLVMLEGPGSLEEGQLFGLSLLEMANGMDANILLIARFHTLGAVDALLAAQARLGSRLLGVMLNDVPEADWHLAQELVKPFLESCGIPVFGILPSDQLLRSVSVSELVHQLSAEVLCRPDRLDLLVDQLTIGAMNVNSALKYFRKGRNMAVVTGGDRTDIQLAALESSTHCLILTGHFSPNSMVLTRADDLEIPVLGVDLDTLTTVEIVDRTFGQVRLHEAVKVECVRQLIEANFDVDRLLSSLDMRSEF